MPPLEHGEARFHCRQSETPCVRAGFNTWRSLCRRRGSALAPAVRTAEQRYWPGPCAFCSQAVWLHKRHFGPLEHCCAGQDRLVRGDLLSDQLGKRASRVKKSEMLVLCVRHFALCPPGDNLAVEIGQAAHTALVRACGAYVDDDAILKRRRLPPADVPNGLVIDDFLLVCRFSTPLVCACPHAEEGCRFVEALWSPVK